MCRTGAGFYVYRVRRYENNDIFYNYVHVCLDFCCGDLRSVGETVDSRPIPASWLAGCSSALGGYSDLAGVSQSDWPLLVQYYKSVN